MLNVQLNIKNCVLAPPWKYEICPSTGEGERASGQQVVVSPSTSLRAGLLNHERPDTHYFGARLNNKEMEPIPAVFNCFG